jgi:hypothetical protein
MIAYSYIETNLDALDKSYLSSKSNKSKMYLSKVATLELCGWIEVSIDDSIPRCSNRILKTKKSKDSVEDKVKNTYGFEYEKHFRSLITLLIGHFGFERIEKGIDAQIVANFKSELGNLKVARNSLAHTYTRGVTPHYDAPSVTKNRYQKVRAGLSEYDRMLRLLY